MYAEAGERLQGEGQAEPERGPSHLEHPPNRAFRTQHTPFCARLA
jgi:hypothetical protein